MGKIEPHPPALLIMAIFSRYDSAIKWARERAEKQQGPIALASDVFDFDDTVYYEKSMGPQLKKTFLAFENLFDPGELPAWKHRSNGWEEDYAAEHDHPETRPLNLDPGYITQAKLVLATTKDRDHRLYMGQGIYAETTLHYQRGQGWRPRDWTYPDYRRESYHAFFEKCRIYLRQRRHEC